MIPLFKVYSNPSICSSLQKVFDSGFIGQGVKTDEFEEKLKTYLDSEYVVTTNSATSAEHLILHMLKIPPIVGEERQQMFVGDEVLATPLTCTATNWPILANGYKIKWVDVDPNTLNMDLDDLSRKITSKTKALMLVHWGGYPVDLDKLNLILDKAKSIYGFRIFVIEDCAHAFGSTYKKRKIGSSGNACTFSFQAIKHLTCGDGGALVLPNYTYYKKAKLLRWYGIDREENRKDFRCEADILNWGFKFHMNDIAASIGLSNFEEVIHNNIPIHKDNGRFYSESLKNINGITILDSIYDSSYWIYTIKVERQKDFMEYMNSCGIMVSRVHERNDNHTCVAEFKTLLPSLDKIVSEMICIPVGWWVTKEDREYIVSCIKKGW